MVGKWSVKDLVAHITWSESEMVGVLAGRALVGSDLWSLTNDERNEIVYQQNRDRPLDEVLAVFHHHGFAAAAAIGEIAAAAGGAPRLRVR